MSVFVHESGPEGGPAVILLHSSGMTGQQWARLRVRLETRYRVLVPDLLGYGKSPRLARAELSFYEDVDVASALLERAGTAHVVGHSYGGLLAVHAARRAPHRVRTLTAFEPVAMGVLYSRADDPRALAELDAIADGGSFFESEHGGGDAWMRRFIDFWNGVGAYDALPEGRRAALLETGRKTFLEVRSLLHDRTPHDAFAVIDAPTLLLSASRSPWSAQRVCAVLAEALPNARVVTLEGVGHMAPIMAPDRVNDLIIDHVERGENDGFFASARGAP